MGLIYGEEIDLKASRFAGEMTDRQPLWGHVENSNIACQQLLATEAVLLLRQR